MQLLRIDRVIHEESLFVYKIKIKLCMYVSQAGY
jgi:hypothetical protein